MIGKNVLVRDDKAGVLIGTLMAQNGKAWTLSNARKIHYWTKAAAVEGIAAVGSAGNGSRITPTVTMVQGFEAVQIVLLGDAEHTALMESPTWMP